MFTPPVCLGDPEMLTGLATSVGSWSQTWSTGIRS